MNHQHLFLTRGQAADLADQLSEYAQRVDSRNRPMFKGFRLDFEDCFSDQLQYSGAFLAVFPLAEGLLVEDENLT